MKYIISYKIFESKTEFQYPPDNLEDQIAFSMKWYPTLFDSKYGIVNISLQSEINENYHNTEITYDDMRYLTDRRSLKFTKSEYERLKDEFLVTGLYFSLVDNDMSIDFSYMGRKNGYIKKLDDDWYTIAYQSYARYYKCDTIDGLIEELKRYIL